MLEVKRNGDVLDIIGEVDVSTAEIFRDGITELIDEDVPVISLDLQNMEYIDSSGSARRYKL